MTTLTIDLPDQLTEQLQTSGLSQQQLEALVTNFIQNYLHQHQSNRETMALAAEDISQIADEQLAAPLPEDIAADLAQLDYLADDDLWLAAQTRLTSADAEQMQALLDKQQLAGLTIDEQRMVQQLSHRYNRTMLIRAKAAALLKERGYDISALKQRPPVE